MDHIDSPRRRDRALAMLARQYDRLEHRTEQGRDTAPVVEVIVQWEREAQRCGATTAQIEQFAPRPRR